MICIDGLGKEIIHIHVYFEYLFLKVHVGQYRCDFINIHFSFVLIMLIDSSLKTSKWSNVFKVTHVNIGVSDVREWHCGTWFC